MNICAKIRRKLLKLRLQPIRVFCFHQVSETFDEAYEKWKHNWYRRKKYAVLTADNNLNY